MPTEWYTTRFNADDLDLRTPPYDDSFVFAPSERISLGHFKAASFADRSEPVALTDPAGFKVIYSYSNTFLLKPGTTRLTLDDVKARLGPWLNEPTHPRLPDPGTRPPQGPDPDADPLHLRPVLPWPVGVGVILVGTISLIFRRRSPKATKS